MKQKIYYSIGLLLLILGGVSGSYGLMQRPDVITQKDLTRMVLTEHEDQAWGFNKKKDLVAVNLTIYVDRQSLNEVFDR